MAARTSCFPSDKRETIIPWTTKNGSRSFTDLSATVAKAIIVKKRAAREIRKKKSARKRDVPAGGRSLFLYTTHVTYIRYIDGGTTAVTTNK